MATVAVLAVGFGLGLFVAHIAHEARKLRRKLRRKIRRLFR